MLEHFAILLFAAHLLAVNVASTGPLIAAWLDLREGRGDATAGRVGRQLVTWSLIGLVVGSLLGVAMGMAFWDDGYRLATFRLKSKIYYGVAEIAFSLVLILVQGWCWQRGWGNSRRGRWGRGFLALLASTNLLYHFPLLLVVFARIASGVDSGDTPLTSADFRQRIVDSTVLARSLHFWLASVAVGGAALMAAAARGLKPSTSPLSTDHETSPSDQRPDEQRLDDQPPSDLDDQRLVAWGARLALVPTLLQMLSGVWLLVQLEPDVQGRILGGDVAASLTFVAGVGGALWLMHRFAGLALGAVTRRSVLVTLVGLALVVLFMTATLRQIERRARSSAPDLESSAIRFSHTSPHEYPTL